MIHKPHKYRAKQTIVNGIKFPSKREAARYSELQLLQKAGKIKDLKRQRKFELYVNGKKIGLYISDFDYLEGKDGEYIIEDCKGYRTDLYKWKKRHFEAQYGIKIREI
jgi:hypothetical protein